jgi:glycosyltransferase involved in cell wall biosynthesis
VPQGARAHYSCAMRPRVGFLNVTESANTVISHRIYDQDYFAQLSGEFDTVRIDRYRSVPEIPAWLASLEAQNIDYVFLFIFSPDYLDYIALLDARNTRNSRVGFILVPCILVPRLEPIYRDLPRHISDRDVVFMFSDFVRARLGQLSKRYDDFVVPCLLDVEAFPPNSHPTSDTLELFYCARLVPEKGLAEVYEALGRIKSRRKFKLHIVTAIDAKHANPPFFAHLDKLTELHGLEPHIERHGSLFDQQQVRRDLMSRCDALVHLTTCPGETFGRIVVEAFAAGLAVVTTNWQGVNESVTTDNGYLVDVGPNRRIDLDGVVAALDALYDAATLTRFKQVNRVKAANYDYRPHMRRLRELIEARLA